MLCHYWYFKDVTFKFEPHVCNKCHDFLMTAYELKNIAILNVKGVDFRCILCGVFRDEAVNSIQDGHFRGCSRMKGGGGKKAPLPKICHTYHTMMKLGIVIPYLKKIETKLTSADKSIFSPELIKFCYIKKYRYRLHFST